MLKICPHCRRTYSGGNTCLRCADVALLDVADPSVQRAHLKGDSELRVTIRTYYGARTAMLMLFYSILFGLAFAAAFARKAFFSEGGGRIGWWIASAAALVLLPLATTFVGARLVHRFSRSCRHRPLNARELRVLGRD